MASVTTLIVAAGHGTRFGGDRPKQYHDLAGWPLIRHSVISFQKCKEIDNIRVVADPENSLLLKEALGGISQCRPAIAGGKSRQQSVLNGLEAIAADSPLPDIILIHDAARPLIESRVIDDLLCKLNHVDAVIPVLPIADSIKRVDDRGRISTSVDRHNLYRAQTPQGFRFLALLEAYRAAANTDIQATDDAQVAEQFGIEIHCIPGSATMLKVTTQADLQEAYFHLRHIQNNKDNHVTMRTGLGYDVHAFSSEDVSDTTADKVIFLGGIRLPHHQALIGHSDADVVLHAITDALLGALAEGDIGDHFPPSDPRWQDADSALFLHYASNLLYQRKGVIANIDVVIICEKPKISPYRQAMIHRIAHILSVDPRKVSVKATTSERLGFTGRGEGIAAQAIVLLNLPEAL